MAYGRPSQCSELISRIWYETHARWVAGYVLSRRLQSITARDIGRAYREVRGKGAEIAATMDLLDHAGWVAPDPDRPKGSAWLINPRVHDVFCGQAAGEKARRNALRTQVRVSIAELVK